MAKQAQLTSLLDEQLDWREEVAAEEAAEARQVGAQACCGKHGTGCKRAWLHEGHAWLTVPSGYTANVERAVNTTMCQHLFTPLQEDARIRAAWAQEEAAAAAAAEAERARQQALTAATLGANRQAWKLLLAACQALRARHSTASACFSLPTKPATMKPCCRQRQADLAGRAAQERAADEAIVQEGLRAAAAAEAQECAAREARRAAAVAYREEVVAQMEREQANSEARDAQLAAAMEAQQAKRDAEQAARDQARRRLMRDVCATREQQLAAKQAARAAETEAALRQRLAAEEAARREAEAAEARRQLERQQQLQQCHDLQARLGSWDLEGGIINLCDSVVCAWKPTTCKPS